MWKVGIKRTFPRKKPGICYSLAEGLVIYDRVCNLRDHPVQLYFYSSQTRASSTFWVTCECLLHNVIWGFPWRELPYQYINKSFHLNVGNCWEIEGNVPIMWCSSKHNQVCRNFIVTSNFQGALASEKKTWGLHTGQMIGRKSCRNLPVHPLCPTTQLEVEG